MTTKHKKFGRKKMQGKRQDQIDYSERIAIVAITALIGTITALALLSWIK
jgi:hypothetical protein